MTRLPLKLQMSLLVTFQEQPDALSKLKFGAEYIVSKNHTAFQEDFAPFFEKDSSNERLFRSSWDSVSGSCEAILANFNQFDLNFIEVRVLLRSIVPEFMKLFRIQSALSEYTISDLKSAISNLEEDLRMFCTIHNALRIFGTILPEHHSNFHLIFL